MSRPPRTDFLPGDPDLTPCVGAIRHGPCDRLGRCPWCHLKIRRAMPRYVDPTGPQWQQDAEAAYRRTYDPDWGIDRMDHDPYGTRGWTGEL
jgi:hypothetical protein